MTSGGKGQRAAGWGAAQYVLDWLVKASLVSSALLAMTKRAGGSGALIQARQKAAGLDQVGLVDHPSVE
jgi:hypothetical protein